MKKIFGFVADNWRAVLAGLFAASILGVLLFTKLDTLVPGVAETEIRTLQSSISLEAITNNPLQLPYKLAVLLATKSGFDSIVSYRAISGVLILIGSFFFYRIMCVWYSRRVANLSTFLFATSAWVLHVGRLASPNVLLLGFGLFTTCGVWLQKTKGNARSIVGTFLVGSLLLYVPGSIWFVAALLLWRGKRFISIARSYGIIPLVIWTGAFLLLLAPLVIAFIRDPSLLRSWALIPSEFPEWSVAAKNLLRVPFAIVFRMPEQPVYWLGSLPLLDVFSGTMLLLGAYSYRQKLSLDRTKLLVGFLSIATILIAVNNDFSLLTLMLPFLYLLIAQGIHYMLTEWFTVFPRNPIARILGASIFTLTILVAGFYHVTHYMVAWPNTPDTEQAFEQKL